MQPPLSEYGAQEVISKRREQRSSRLLGPADDRQGGRLAPPDPGCVWIWCCDPTSLPRLVIGVCLAVGLCGGFALGGYWGMALSQEPAPAPVSGTPYTHPVDQAVCVTSASEFAQHFRQRPDAHAPLPAKHPACVRG